MYKRLVIVFYIVFNIVCNLVSAERARIWTRIPKFYVDDRVNNFLNQKRINNCYEFQETPTMLLLKCWRDNKLTNVQIEIKEERKKQKYFGVSLSI